MKNLIQALSLALLIAGAIGGLFYYQYYSQFKKDNVKKEGYILIPRKANFQQVIDSISPKLKDPEAFRKVALDQGMDRYLSPGRYEIERGKGNLELVRMIKNGEQSAHTFRIGDFADIYQMIGKVAHKTEADSLTFVRDLDAIARAKGFQNAEDLKKYFFADTYEFYWTVSPREFFSRFQNRYLKFWTSDRINKEKALNLNRDEVYALASIVYKESGGRKDEQKTIAGLYLNRVRKGMKLQSDPTVIYAVNKDNNFSKIIKRVYYRDLNHPSPYNTYASAGIPPGPICIVDEASVDAVLNAERNDYIYMVADPNKFGYHRFTDTYAEHERNAQEYRRWLDSKKIK